MEEREINEVTKHILALLSDDAFPKLVMLDGAWGVGKTHFINNIVIPDIKSLNHKTTYLSVTGLSDVSDFRDRLLSACYVKKGVSSEDGKSIGEIAGTLLKNFGGENGGLISSLLGNATGIFKDSLMSRLGDRFIIIDDLDRVNVNGLPDLIVGEALQLAITGNLKFIFVINIKETNINSDLKEKAFSGTVKLKKSSEDLIDISFSGYHWMDIYREHITKTIISLGVSNLRILKRCSKKIDQLHGILKNIENIDLDKSMIKICEAIITVSHFHYNKGFDEQKIIKFSTREYPMPRDDSSKVEQYDELINVGHFLSEKLVSFCAGGDFWEPDDSYFGRLVKRDSPIDILMYNNYFEIKDEEFTTYVNCLSDYIFNDVEVPVRQWFERAYYYHYLQSKGYLADSYKNIEDGFDELVQSKVFYNDSSDRYISYRIDEKDNLVYPKFLEYLEKTKKNSEKEEVFSLLEQMRLGWKNVDLIVFKKYRYEPFFNQFSSNEIEGCISSWANEDVLLFNDFLNNRYKASNIKDFLSDELEIMHYLKVVVKAMHDRESKGRRKGCLNVLLSNLEMAVSKLDS
ncbi:P-loop NTPase fold protein [Shewanella sp. YIC-542]|uniref:P-loop NTPase fold protein n=1 Tax=Shewanella mytili TaxID=3377111 RepID=UPI00398EE602